MIPVVGEMVNFRAVIGDYDAAAHVVANITTNPELSSPSHLDLLIRVGVAGSFPVFNIAEAPDPANPTAGTWHHLGS